MSDKDKVHISAYYDEKTNACHSIDVTLNYDGISREDLAETIRSLFHPAALLSQTTTTCRHTELGQTAVMPADQSLPRAPLPSNPPTGGLRLDGRPVIPAFVPQNPARNGTDYRGSR